MGRFTDTDEPDASAWIVQARNLHRGLTVRAIILIVGKQNVMPDGGIELIASSPGDLSYWHNGLVP